MLVDEQLYTLNLRTFGWAEVSTIGYCPVGRLGACMNIVDDKLFLFGGMTMRHTLSPDFLFLDLDARSWMRPKARGEGPSPRESASSVIIGTKIVYFGGMDGKRLGDLYTFDTSDLTWSKVEIPAPSSQLERSLHTAVAVKSTMFVFGGWTNASPSNQSKFGAPWVCSNDGFSLNMGDF